MRAQGDANFPDPNSQGKFILNNPSSSPAYGSANKVCAHLLPGGTESQEQQQQEVAKFLKFAQCMRAHGEPSFPDPSVSSDGGVTLGNLAGLDPNSPQFRSAESACRSFLPAGFPGL